MSLEDATPEDKPDNCEWFDETDIIEAEHLAEQHDCKVGTHCSDYTIEDIKELNTKENIVTISGHVFNRHHHTKDNPSSDDWSEISVKNIYVYSRLDIDTLLKCIHINVGGGHKEVFEADGGEAVKLHFD